MEKNTKLVIVDSESAGMRLDLFLSVKLGITRSQAQKLISGNSVLINNAQPKKTGEKVSEGDNITIEAPGPNPISTTETPIVSTHEFRIEDIKIIKETPEYLIIEKPWGMLTHSTGKHETDSLAELLVKKYPELSKIGEDPLRPGIVHRLDKEASGLLVIPRTTAMFDHLKNLFKTRQMDKEYIVLVHGQVEKDWDEINFPITRSRTSDRMAAIPETLKGEKNDEGQRAKTEFWVEKRFVNFTLLKVKIHTGRMHQIRAHFLAYNHPAVGDPLYFQKKIKRTWDEKLGRLFLHCCHLAFTDLNGTTVSFTSSLPKTLGDFLEILK